MKRSTKEYFQVGIKKEGQITSSRLAKTAGISRQAAHKLLARLVAEKRLLKVGKTRQAYYIPFSGKREKELKSRPVKTRLRNKGLQEDAVFDDLARKSRLINTLPANAKGIFRYAFTEMVNNAIEHSLSPYIDIEIYQKNNFVHFKVDDYGIGVFNSIRKKYRLKDDYEAVQEILKGKKTTMPKKHSGEGIFFTSKISDCFELFGNRIKLTVNNEVDDVFVKKSGKQKGTRVLFRIKNNTKKSLAQLFADFTNEEYQFSKTKVTVKLFQRGEDYISRSQARRLLYDLDKFQTIVLDFKQIKEIGQGFADEIFRVFARQHPDISIEIINACTAVSFMINRAKAPAL